MSGFDDLLFFAVTVACDDALCSPAVVACCIAKGGFGKPGSKIWFVDDVVWFGSKADLVMRLQDPLVIFAGVQ